ncbi:hypothetical protein FOZ62_013882, partial [Perkinsus olseni]
KKSSKAKSVPGGSGGNKVGDDGTGNIREEEEESGSELASLHSSGSSSDDSSNNSSKDGSSEDQESDDTVSESSSESSPSSSSSSEEEKQAKSFYVPNEITDSYTQTLQPPELPPPFGNLPGMLNFLSNISTFRPPSLPSGHDSRGSSHEHQHHQLHRGLPAPAVIDLSQLRCTSCGERTPLCTCLHQS